MSEQTRLSHAKACGLLRSDGMRLGKVLVTVMLALAGCAHDYDSSAQVVAVESPPPAPTIQTPPSRPFASATWQPGHWNWDRAIARYVWQPGRWVASRPGLVYVPAHWLKEGRTFIEVPGQWVTTTYDRYGRRVWLDAAGRAHEVF